MTTPLTSIIVPADKRIDTTADLEAVLADITFKNSVLDFQWRYQHKPFYDGVDYTTPQMMKNAGWLIWVEFWRPDVVSGEMGWGRGRDEIVKIGAYESGVVKTAYVLYRFVVEHEMMEGFHYKGIRIFNPHHTVHELSIPAILAQAASVDMDAQKNVRNSVEAVK